MAVTPIAERVRRAMADGEILDAEVVCDSGLDGGLRFLADQRSSLVPSPESLDAGLAEERGAMTIDALIDQIQHPPGW